MGLYGMVVVTTAPAGLRTAPGTAYPGVTYNADVPLLLSEIDPVQNNAVEHRGQHGGFQRDQGVVRPARRLRQSELRRPTNTCYPPAVNYTPLYYLINGVAFDKTNASSFAVPDRAGHRRRPATVLVRMVNAGLRMHVPSIVGSQTGTPAVSGFSLIAEDGNPLPGIPRVQSEVFMAAGKTYDVMINVPAAGGTALPIFDRQLSLSGNATARDAGMLAYISINGAALPSAPALARCGSQPGYL